MCCTGGQRGRRYNRWRRCHSRRRRRIVIAGNLVCFGPKRVDSENVRRANECLMGEELLHFVKHREDLFRRQLAGPPQVVVLYQCCIHRLHKDKQHHKKSFTNFPDETVHHWLHVHYRRVIIYWIGRF